LPIVSAFLLEPYSPNSCIKGVDLSVVHHRYQTISWALLRLDPSLCISRTIAYIPLLLRHQIRLSHLSSELFWYPSRLHTNLSVPLSSNSLIESQALNNWNLPPSRQNLLASYHTLIRRIKHWSDTSSFDTSLQQPLDPPSIVSIVASLWLFLPWISTTFRCGQRLSKVSTAAFNMSQSERPSMQQSVSPRNSPSVLGSEALKAKSDEWSDITDPNERRKIQNKLAQRRFRKFMFRVVSDSTNIF
jgi:hypothetical protein